MINLNEKTGIIKIRWVKFLPHADVAQLVERFPYMEEDVGSSPTVCTKDNDYG